jgi:hypothetical protein
MSSGVDVLVSVGDVEARIVSLAARGPGEVSVTVLFSVGEATISLTFDADRFLAFVEQLQKFAETMPGRPS